MLYIIIFSILTLFLISIFIRLKINNLDTHKLDTHKDEILPYKPRWNFMSRSEISFYKQLELAVGDKYYIVPQLQLSKILWSPKGKYQNKIDRKTLDFVLFSKTDFKFYKAIELDDFTHDRPDRKERDLFVDNAMKTAGLELVHVNHRESFKG